MSKILERQFKVMIIKVLKEFKEQWMNRVRSQKFFTELETCEKEPNRAEE